MADRFLVYEQPVAGPSTHALIVGVGAYPHLNGGRGRRSDDHDGMGQLSSPPISARMLATWLMASFRHPTKRLASVALLLSEAKATRFVSPIDSAATFKVETANFTNVSAALKEWSARGNANADNLMLFFFCGHGISAGTDMALLLADYGADSANSLNGAIDFRRNRLGMATCKASEQCYFIDACRASTDTLIEAEFAGQVVIRPKRRDPTWPQWRAPVFYATAKGDKAYAFPGGPTAYTEALLKSFNDLAADDEEGDWRVSTHRLQEAVEHLVVRKLAESYEKVQIPTGNEVSKIHLHYLSREPNAIVYVQTEPPEALKDIQLTYQTPGAAPVPAPPDPRATKSDWEFLVPTGMYQFIGTLPSGVARRETRYIRPVYGRVTLRLMP